MAQELNVVVYLAPCWIIQTAVAEKDRKVFDMKTIKIEKRKNKHTLLVDTRDTFYLP